MRFKIAEVLFVCFIALTLACAQKAPTVKSQDFSPSRASDTAIKKDRFIVKGDEVYDRKTDRTGKRCNYGQTWDDQNNWCTGIIKRVPIDHAASEVEGIKGGWRIPDVNEMMSIMDVSCGTEKDKAQGIFADVKSSEWYATSTPHGDSHVMAVECMGAQAKAAGVGNQMFSIIRLVREGK